MQKQKKFLGLSDAERSEISILKERGCGVREIARALGRSPNTVSYDVKVPLSATLVLNFLQD
jgi:IS30 family transposase